MRMAFEGIPLIKGMDKEDGQTLKQPTGTDPGKLCESRQIDVRQADEEEHRPTEPSPHRVPSHQVCALTERHRPAAGAPRSMDAAQTPLRLPHDRSPHRLDDAVQSSRPSKNDCDEAIRFHRIGIVQSDHSTQRGCAFILV